MSGPAPMTFPDEWEQRFRALRAELDGDEDRKPRNAAWLRQQAVNSRRMADLWREMFDDSTSPAVIWALSDAAGYRRGIAVEFDQLADHAAARDAETANPEGTS